MHRYQINKQLEEGKQYCVHRSMIYVSIANWEGYTCFGGWGQKGESLLTLQSEPMLYPFRAKQQVYFNASTTSCTHCTYLCKERKCAHINQILVGAFTGLRISLPSSTSTVTLQSHLFSQWLNRAAQKQEENEHSLLVGLPLQIHSHLRMSLTKIRCVNPNSLLKIFLKGLDQLT